MDPRKDKRWKYHSYLETMRIWNEILHESSSSNFTKIHALDFEKIITNRQSALSSKFLRQYIIDFIESEKVDNEKPENKALTPDTTTVKKTRYLKQLIGSTTSRPIAKQVHQPPLTFWVRILKLACSRKIYEKVFEPVIADSREEYFEALQSGEMTKANIITLKGNIFVIATLICLIPSKVLQFITSSLTFGK